MLLLYKSRNRLQGLFGLKRSFSILIDNYLTYQIVRGNRARRLYISILHVIHLPLPADDPIDIRVCLCPHPIRVCLCPHPVKRPCDCTCEPSRIFALLCTQGGIYDRPLDSLFSYGSPCPCIVQRHAWNSATGLEILLHGQAD